MEKNFKSSKLKTWIQLKLRLKILKLTTILNQMSVQSGTQLIFSFAYKSFSCEKVHTLKKGVNVIPHTSLEPLSRNEIIVIGGDSYGNPSQDADSVIIDTVSCYITVLDFTFIFRLLTRQQNSKLMEVRYHQPVECKFFLTKRRITVVQQRIKLCYRLEKRNCLGVEKQENCKIDKTFRSVDFGSIQR